MLFTETAVDKSLGRSFNLAQLTLSKQQQQCNTRSRTIFTASVHIEEFLLNLIVLHSIESFALERRSVKTCKVKWIWDERKLRKKSHSKKKWSLSHSLDDTYDWSSTSSLDLIENANTEEKKERHRRWKLEWDHHHKIWVKLRMTLLRESWNSNVRRYGPVVEKFQSTRSIVQKRAAMTTTIMKWILCSICVTQQPLFFQVLVIPAGNYVVMHWFRNFIMSA